MTSADTPSADARLPLVLSSKDPSFSGLLEHLCQNSPIHFVTTAGPAITLETVRSNAPAIVLIDLDSLDSVEASRLVLKLSLVTSAKLLLTGCDTVPGHPALDALMHAGAHGSLLKPEGKTSLSLTGEPGRQYLASLLQLAPSVAQGRSS